MPPCSQCDSPCRLLVIGVTTYDIHRSIKVNDTPPSREQLESLGATIDISRRAGQIAHDDLLGQNGKNFRGNCDCGRKLSHGWKCSSRLNCGRTLGMTRCLWVLSSTLFHQFWSNLVLSSPSHAPLRLDEVITIEELDSKRFKMLNSTDQSMTHRSTGFDAADNGNGRI